MSLRTVVGAVLFLVFVAPSQLAQAANCTEAYAYRFDARASCAAVGGACPIAAPVTFELVSGWSNPPLECATVTWSFDDGSSPVVTSGAQPITRTFAGAGKFAVTATITTAASTWPSTDKVVISVGNGYVGAIGGRVKEGGDDESFHISRSNIVGESVVAWSLRTSGGDLASDVSPASGTVTIPAGAASTPVSVTAIDDDVHSGNRSYSIMLESVAGGYLNHAGAAATLEVTEDDFADVRLDATNLTSLSETTGTIALRFTREGLSSSTVGVHYSIGSIAKGVVPISGVLSFAPGQTEAFLTVTIVNDAIHTTGKALAGSITSHTAGTRVTTTSYYSDRYEFSFPITDDEPAPPPPPPPPPPTPVALTVDDVTVTEGHTGTTEKKFTIRLAKPLTSYLSLEYRLGGSAHRWNDYSINSYSSSVSLYEGTTEATITVLIVGDDEVEGHETIILNLRVWSSPDRVALPRPAVMTILNDDAGFGPEEVQIERGLAGAAMINLGGPASTPVVVGMSVADPALVGVPPTVTIEAGQNGIEIPLQGLAVGWTQVTATPPASWGPPMTIDVTVHEPGRVVFDPPAVLVETDGKISVRVALDPPSAEPHTLQLEMVAAAVAGADKSVTIPPGQTGTIVIMGAKPGVTTLVATMPKAFGRKTAMLDVRVEEPAARSLLRSIVPSTGPIAGGTQFEANGALLSVGCVLLFGGVPASNLELVSESLMTGTTPTHAAGTVGVELLCGGSRFLLENAFTYLAAPPALTSVTPAFGSIRGGTHVRVAATNVRSGCWLFLDGVAAGGVVTHGTTELTASTPAREKGGPVAVAIRCGDQAASLSNAFTYTTAVEPAASVMNVTPLAAAPGEAVTITGSRFRRTDRVTFDDVAAAQLSSTPDSHVVRVPELPLGLASIDLTDAEGRSSTTGPIFTVLEPARPHITSAAPARVRPGAEVELRGSSFRPAYSFAAGGKPARLVSMTPERAVIRLSAEASAGVHQVFIVNPSGHVAVIGPAIEIAAAGVVADSVTPPCGSTEGGTFVTLLGNGFATDAAVTFNGVAARDVEVLGSTVIRGTVPPGATGFARVLVTNGDGTYGTVSDGFFYRSPFDPEGCGASRGRSVRH